MTKRHFIALAQALRSLKPEETSNDTTTREYFMWREAVRTVASVCASSNPRFNRSRFFDACGMEDY